MAKRFEAYSQTELTGKLLIERERGCFMSATHTLVTGLARGLHVEPPVYQLTG